MKKILFSKPFCIIILSAAFVYGLALPFFWGNNPSLPTGTLSLLCEDRKVFFWLWGILMSGGINVNAQYMYRKFNYKNRFLDALCILSFLSMCIVALTLGHSIADWNPKRLLHWIATGMFIAFCALSVALFFILNIKDRKDFILPTVLIIGILLTFVVLFVFVGKSAIMEMVPLAMLQMLLFAVNFTPWLKSVKTKKSVMV